MIMHIIVTVILSGLSIIYIVLISMKDTPISTKNENVKILSWVIACIGLLFWIVPFLIPLTFLLRKYVYILGAILLALGISGLVFGYQIKDEESKVDMYNKISYSLAAITFFAIGNLSPKLI